MPKFKQAQVQGPNRTQTVFALRGKPKRTFNFNTKAFVANQRFVPRGRTILTDTNGLVLGVS